jgi:hypothetical protein
MLFIFSVTHSFLRHFLTKKLANFCSILPEAEVPTIQFRKKPKKHCVGKPKGYDNNSTGYVLERHTLSGLPSKKGNKDHFLVLGIESSCDDTGVAIVSSQGKILSNVVYSQYSIHEKFGGVVPSLAMEAHKTRIHDTVDEAVRQAGLQSLDEIDAVAVTKGPGLEICLRVGVRKAQVTNFIHCSRSIS